jgi:hypothetical protein
VLPHSSTLLYPLAFPPTLVGLTLLPGVSAVVTELLAGPVPNNQLAPWDRGATLWGEVSQGAIAGGAATVTVWTYTVPAGLWLMLEWAECETWTAVVATAAILSTTRLTIGGFRVLNTRDTQGTVLSAHSVDTLTGPLYLPSGTVLLAEATNSNTGGSVNYECAAAGLLFNA